MSGIPDIGTLRVVRTVVVRNRRLLYLSMAIFGSFFMLALMTPTLSASEMSLFTQQGATAETSESFGFVQSWLNNVVVVLILSLGGLLIGLPTITTLSFNGLFIGYQIKTYIGAYPTLLAASATLLPHSLFEIPGLLVAAAAGLRLPKGLIQYLRGRPRVVTRADLTEFLVLFLLALGLITIGAVVEVYATPRIYQTVV